MAHNKVGYIKNHEGTGYLSARDLIHWLLRIELQARTEAATNPPIDADTIAWFRSEIERIG